MRDRGLAHVKTGAVCFGIDSHSRDVERAKGSKDTARYGAAIGDKDFLEHERWGCVGGPSRHGEKHAAVVRGKTRLARR